MGNDCFRNIVIQSFFRYTRVNHYLLEILIIILSNLSVIRNNESNQFCNSHNYFIVFHLPYIISLYRGVKL